MVKVPDPRHIDLRAVVYQEGEWWIAHCLELDLVAEGKTPRAALEDVVDLIEFQIRVAIEEDDLNSIFRPAPPEIWALYSQTGKELRPPRKKKASPVSRIVARGFTFC